MTLEKAIKDLDEILDLKKPLKDKDYKPAIKLGSEAMKQFIAWRADGGLNPDFMLPGETK